MRTARSVLPILLVGALVALAGAVHAGPDRYGEQRGESTEVLVGSYHCGIGANHEGYAWMFFQATGDLLLRELNLYDEIRSDGPPGPACDALAAGAVAIGEGYGCTAGSILGREDEEGGASRDVNFVCHGLRSALVRAIADLSGYVLTTP